MIRVQAIASFMDTESNKLKQVGDIFEVDEKRKDVLLGDNVYKQAFVKLVEEEVEEATKPKQNVQKAVKGKKKATKITKDIK